MKTYSCPCGNLKSYGSDIPNSCVSCSVCGLTVMGDRPIPHQYHLEVKDKDGFNPNLKMCFCGELSGLSSKS